MQDKLYIPEIDYAVPLPLSQEDAFAEPTISDELAMRARTIKLISDLTGQPIKPDEEQRNDAEILAKVMVTDPSLRPAFSKYPNETIAYLAGMVASYNCQIVDDLAEIKNYVLNKLVYEIENTSHAKDRISALRLLGEIDGVNAFKSHSEVTVNFKPIEQVEKELKEVLDSLEVSVEVRSDSTSSIPTMEALPHMPNPEPELASHS